MPVLRRRAPAIGPPPRLYPARAFPASAPESRRIPPAPCRPVTCPPRAVAPDTRPLWASRDQAPHAPRWRPAARKERPGFRTENARCSARHSVRRTLPRRKPARVRPAAAHCRLPAAPARLRHSRRPAPPRSAVPPRGDRILGLFRLETAAPSRANFRKIPGWGYCPKNQNQPPSNGRLFAYRIVLGGCP